MACKPLAKAVQTGKEDAFVYICLIELVANLLAESGRDHHAEGKLRVSLQIVLHPGAGVAQDAKEGILVEDALIDGGRLEEQEQGLTIAKLLKVVEGWDHFFEEIGGPDVAAFAFESLLKLLGEAAMGSGEVDGHDGAILTRMVSDGGEVEGNERRVTPVDEARRKAMVLGEGEPIPNAPFGWTVNALDCVLTEVSKKVALDGGSLSAEPGEAAGDLIADAA